MYSYHNFKGYIISRITPLANRYLHTLSRSADFSTSISHREDVHTPKEKKGLSHNIHPSIHASNQSIQSPPPTPESTSTPETHLKDKPSAHFPPKKVTLYRFYSPLPLHPPPILTNKFKANSAGTQRTKTLFNANHIDDMDGRYGSSIDSSGSGSGFDCCVRRIYVDGNVRSRAVFGGKRERGPV